MNIFDEENGASRRRNSANRPYDYASEPIPEIDYAAAVARAMEADTVDEVDDYAAAIARAIGDDPVTEVDYSAAVARAMEREPASQGISPPPIAQQARRVEQAPPIPARNGRRPRRRRRLVRRVIAAVLVFSLLMMGTLYFLMRPPAGGDAFTVLIAGQDNVGTYGLTDTLMLAHVNTENGTIDLVSIPRDTRVDVSWGGKINSVFAMTGGRIERLMEEVEKLVGFMPDFYVVLDMQAFVELVDALGGVYLEVPFRMQYSDPYDDPPLHIDLEAGYQQLTGDQAMQFVRYRTFDGDIGRMQRQQQFLQAVAAQSLRVRNIPRIPSFTGIFTDHVETDLPLSGMTYLGQRMMRMDDENINFHTMPNEPFGGDLVPILDPWLTLINDHLNPHATPVRLENLRLFTRIDGTIQAVGNGHSLSR